MDLVARLRAAVGEAQVITDPDGAAPFSSDWTRRWSGRPVAVVSPGSTGEVADVVRACAAAEVALVPQGGNTGLVGAGVPQDGEVVLSLRRINRVGPVDQLARTVTAGAGATLSEVQAIARGAGLELGIDFPAREHASIGGIVATNAGGGRVQRHGVTRGQVRGLEAVLSDGSVVRRLSGLPKDNTGYDLVQLLTGSEGTLGVITAVQLRLVRPAAATATALVAVRSTADAMDVLATVRARFETLDAAEYFHDDGLRLVLRHRGVESPFGRPHPVYLLIEIADTEGSGAGDLLATLERHPAVRDVVLAADPDQRARLWELRDAHTEAINARGVPVKLDVALPLERVADFEQRLPDVVRAVAPRGVPILFGHLAEGNVHVNLLEARDDDEGGAVTDAVLRLVAELGGSISAEHGIGLAKRRWLSLTRTSADIAAMRAVKQALDPANILSPGRVLPPR